MTLPLLFPALALALALSTGSPQSPSPAVPAQSPPATIAIAESEVDEAITEVENLRGWTFKQPVKRQRTTLEQARRDIQRNLDKAIPVERRALTGAFLATTGLVPAELDLTGTLLSLLEQQVAGYYEPETETLHLVQRTQAMPAFVERIVLVHELTHALDDQYADIGALTAPGEDRTEDMDIVVTSIVEGSATALMLQHMLRAQAAGRVDPSELVEYASQEMARAKVFEGLPRYFSAIFGSYILGAGFLANGEMGAILSMPDNRLIGERFVAARRALPRSSEQLLHPEKYWDPARRDDPMALDDDAIERWLTGPGRRIVHRDTLGELLTAVLTTPSGTKASLEQLQSAAAWTNAAAQGWGGDQFYLLASGASAGEAERSLKDVRGVWVTAWDTAADRDQFQAAVAVGSTPRGTVAVPFGPAGAVVFFGFVAPEREELTRKLAEVGARFIKPR